MYQAVVVTGTVSIPALEFARKRTVQYVPLLNIGVDKVVIVNDNYIEDVFIQLLRPLLGQPLERVELYGTKIKLDCT
ncbi:unnamed protein product [Allacma fusca]|uniref:Uncharacterized protein n=1 Tax=Allacma fusca TaxID=39272 RepID=A0A8J2JQS8_9HEXA|nr:unnamed protein product [Allacma fusca]